jgi:large subunit GTPase 1
LKLAEQNAKQDSEDEDEDEDESDNEESKSESAEPVLPQNNDDEFYPSAFGKSASKDPRIQILSCSELLDLFHATAQPSTNPEIPEQYRNKITIGLVGYPNVGKSSTINALIGTKKVAVASTPGKTKHFQTLHLDDKTILCDCPGLVFPSFATTQANMVCDGVLPIDTLREHTGPIGLVVRRVPKWYLEALYGIHISMPTVEEGGDGTNIPQPEDFLKSYAMARGFTKAGQGNPDEARGSRYILKDYINAKLLYNHPPPDCKDVEAFNKEIYCVENLPKKKLFTAAEPTKQKKLLGTNTNLLTSKALDSQFFTSQKSLSAHAISKGKYQTDKFGRSTVYPHQRMANADGTISLQPSGPQSEFMVKDKKHRKGKKSGKVRNRMGYDV